MFRELEKITEHDLPQDYEQLKPSEQDKIQRWITNHLTPTVYINHQCTSYGLKHYFEASPGGFYITNGMFKGAMLAANYRVGDTSAKNWNFNVSKKAVRLLLNQLKLKHN